MKKVEVDEHQLRDICIGYFVFRVLKIKHMIYDELFRMINARYSTASIQRKIDDINREIDSLEYDEENNYKDLLEKIGYENDSKNCRKTLQDFLEKVLKET